MPVEIDDKIIIESPIRYWRESSSDLAVRGEDLADEEDGDLDNVARTTPTDTIATHN